MFLSDDLVRSSTSRY